MIDRPTPERKISYRFEDRELLLEALTHSSYAQEHSASCKHNERLEFLGDAFLDSVISEELIKVFPNKGEGFLSRTRASLVCEKSLAIQARKIDLGSCLRLGHGEEKSGGRDRDSILADGFEALMGAIFLDGGYDAVKKTVLCLFEESIEDAIAGKFIITDYKTALQEILQAEGYSTASLSYVDAKQEGPDHDKTFTVELMLDGRVIGTGKGKSKKQAQQKAAEEVLNRRKYVI